MIDAITKEERYFTEKFPGKKDLIDMRVRENVLGLSKTATTIKCYYGMNHYGERD